MKIILILLSAFGIKLVHFPVCKANHYHHCLFFGTPQEIPKFKYSIGSGNEEYLTAGFGHQLFSFPHGGFLFDGKMTVRYISYQSSDITDKNNVLLGWLSVTVSHENDVEGLALMARMPVWDKRDIYPPGAIVTTRFNSACKEKFGNKEFEKKLLAPGYNTGRGNFFVPIGAAISKPYKLIQFTFRTDFPECATLNEKNKFHFVYFGSTGIGKNVSSPEQNQLSVNDYTYGGWDPEPPRDSQSVTCNKSVTTENIWVKDSKEDAMEKVNGIRNPSDIMFRCHQSHISHFNGRCSLIGDFNASVDFPFHCVRYYDRRGSKTGGGAYDSHEPEFPNDGRPCVSCVEARNLTREYGVSASSLIGLLVWGPRSAHGVFMCMSTMLILPLGLLFARYFKDSFMNARYVNLHFWYGIHIGASMTGFSGLLGGWIPAILASRYFGYSTHPMSWAHRISGYLGLLLFLLGMCSGPLRNFPKTGRKVSIFLHFLTGDIARIMFDLALLTSFYIPASPSSTKDVQVDGFTMQPYSFLVLLWIIADAGVHFFLQIQLSQIDRTVHMPKKRTYAMVVPIPLLKPSTEKDLPGTSVRRIVLIVHTLIGLLCALILSFLICFNEPIGRFFGPMTFTHKPSGKLNFFMPDLTYEN